MTNQYRISSQDQLAFKQEYETAFQVFRDEIARWKALDPLLNVALGGDSHTGEWSIVFEDGFWLVFIGERGKRYQVSLFTSVWDALSYAGFRATATSPLERRFPVLAPQVSLS